MNKKVIVWGVGTHLQLLLDNFMNLTDFIVLFVDKYRTENNFHGINMVHPDRLSNYRGFPVVIAARGGGFREIYNELRHKFLWEKENIFSSHEWICYLIEKNKIMFRPTHVRLEVCTLCQLDCVSCHMRRHNYGTIGKGWLPFQTFKEFVDKNTFIKSIEISNFGEPFLNPDLKEILQYAAERDITVTVGNGTNFNYLSDEMAELLVTGTVSMINVSIDGASQEIYSIYRRKGNFKNVIENIKRVNYYKKLYKTEKPRLQWQYILMPHNECDIEKAVKMANELGMNICFKYDGVEDGFEPVNRRKIEDITGLKYFSRREYNANNLIKYGQDMCYSAIYCPQINYDGRLLGCCVPWKEDLGVNVFEQGLIPSLNSDQYRTMVKILLGIERDIKEIESPCLHCEYNLENIKKGNFVYF